ncbi:glutathione peroxidase [Paenibacillus phyllosphaerae]|uniref:Glutathione peroxidase n=1 Tax=Paenibacillus phyllosphaerae TaxID=274593 RepID=A0A7W5AXP2_9BACL|nr:glutathione peroxidase [Paenibacillus phyllosphaerae]MBB3110663.1 glutathione peroxidase [Paenibacillus phyllosphaerae]
MSTIYDYQAATIKGEERSLAEYKGKVLLVVNTASKCGLTPQYEGLQELYEAYKDQGLEIIGFPSNQFNEQEPGTNDEVEAFCKVNYGVSFPLFAKTDVRGETAHPVFQYLTEAAPFQGFDQNDPASARMGAFLSTSKPDWMGDNSVKWNFTKFLVNRDGQVVKRFEPSVVPAAMKADIEALL